MTSCHRVPAFPLAAAASLCDEAKAALAREELSPEALDSLYSTIASLRREIHANPEPGFEEKKTNALLRNMLTTLAGIPESAFSNSAGTGLIVDLVGEGPGKAPEGTAVRTIALRADMDALRMTEGNNGLPYRSSNEGVAHLCGHDGHMASLVGAAALLRRRLTRLPRDCKVRLLFQPAEEGPGGADPMVKEGCLKGVDEVAPPAPSTSPPWHPLRSPPPPPSRSPRPLHSPCPPPPHSRPLGALPRRHVILRHPRFPSRARPCPVPHTSTARLCPGPGAPCALVRDPCPATAQPPSLPPRPPARAGNPMSAAAPFPICPRLPSAGHLRSTATITGPRGPSPTSSSLRGR